MTTMVLCERADHVRRARSQAPDATIVALTPESAWTCQQQGVAYRCLDAWYSHAEINVLADETLRRQYAWARWVDPTLWRAIPEFAAQRFTPAWAQLFLLKRVMDGFIRTAQILTDVAARGRPDRLVVFEREPCCPDVGVGLPSRVTRPLFALLASDVVGDSVPVEVWPEEREVASTSFQQSHRRLLTWLRNREEGSRAKLRRLWGNGWARGARVAWVGSTGYDLAHVVSRLQRRGIALVRPEPLAQLGASHRLNAERIHPALERAWNQVAESPDFWQPFDAVSPNLRPSVRPFLHRWMVEQVPVTWAQFLGAKAWLRRARVQALLGTEVPAHLVETFSLAAHSLGLPRILGIHHGGLLMDVPIRDCVGPMHSDVYLTYARHEIPYYERLGEALDTFPRAQIVPVGSARLEALRASPRRRRAAALRRRFADGGRPVVLYVPTQFRSHYRYFCEGSTSDVAYFELQQRILRCCAEVPRARLLYKPFPGEFAVNPIPEFIERFVPNARVVHAPITDLMWAVDAIIVDFPSTAVTEAAVTDRPLVVYAGRDWARLVPEAKAALAERAWVSETPEEFETHVRRLLAAERWPAVREAEADAFLRIIGVDATQPPAVERAADVICRVLKNGGREPVTIQEGGRWTS